MLSDSRHDPRRAATTQGGFQAKPHTSRDRSTWQTIVRRQPIVTAAPGFAPAPQDSRKGTFPLELGADIAPRAKVHTEIMPPLAARIHLTRPRPAKRRNPRARKGIPHFQGILRAHPDQGRVLRIHVRRTQGGDAAQRRDAHLNLFIEGRRGRGPATGRRGALSTPSPFYYLRESSL